MKRYLFIIVFVAFLIRFIGIDSIPPGVNRDEASIGYTAYSILKTGKDEYSRLFPLSFQSFGDWKLPLYIYASIPFIATMGLSEISVRLLSVLSGTGTVLLIYYLVLLLYENQFQQANDKHKTKTIDKITKISVNQIALLSSLLLAISPWHIHFSRIAYEANVAVFLTIVATVCVLKSFQKPILLIPASLFFALTFYTYHGNHVFTSLFVVGLFMLFWKKLKVHKFLIPSLVIFIILAGIIFKATLFEANTTKLSNIGLFGDPSTILYKIELPRLEHESSSIFARLVHNKYTYAIETFSRNYINSFSPDFLFIKGGNNHAHNIPDMGNLYLIDAPFLLLGLAYLFKNYRLKWVQIVLLWLIISPIAPSITKDAPHSARMFSIIPALIITIAIGMYVFIHKITHIKLKLLMISCILLLYSISATQYFDKYAFHFPRTDWQYWGIKYKVLTQHINSLPKTPQKIIITRPETSPYIFMLFYTSYDPKKFQNEVVRYPPTSDGFLHVQSYSIYEFRGLYLDKDLISENLIALDPDLSKMYGMSSYIPLYAAHLPDPVLYVSQ
jgi:4-amino-4-deoxy-L-arabinose transferase-like glycosyltransferase